MDIRILALIVIIFGILVIVFKDLLNWLVGIALILVGIWLFIDNMNKAKSTSKPSQQQPTSQRPKEGPK